MRKLIFIGVILMLLPEVGAAQRCVTEEIREYYQIEPIDQFESWLLQKKSENRGRSLLRTETVLQIPVVVHIIHNGEPLGTGINMTDDQVIAQIQVINEDFRRLNPDATDTQAEFIPVAADFEVEFVLAKQDPEGLPTSGIERVDGQRASWSWSEQGIMKSKSYWPTEDYLNVWVSDLTGSNGQNVLGFAQYPTTTLPGVDFGGKHRLVDGVAIDYTVFGSEIYYPAGNYNVNFDRGRTLTHELGHFFGLRHIWGDGFSCGADDYVADTPDQLNDTNGCPGSKNTCTTNDMFQNYMDYTNDACMNIFTEDQKTRVRTVLMESPRRLSLMTSHGLLDPVIYTNDAGIVNIEQPGDFQCSGTFTPELTIRNYGSSNLADIEVQMSIDGVPVETLNVSPNLGYLNSANLSFSSISAGSKEYIFEILSVNGMSDENPLSNERIVNTVVPQNAATPLLENFESSPDNWIIENPDDNIGWVVATAPKNSGSNMALLMENHNYDALGELDYLVSPVFDLTDATIPFLHFDVAYALYPSEDQDALTVGVIQGCESLIEIDTIYHKGATSLATSSATSSYFVPLNNSDWRNEGFIPLQDYIGMDQVQIVFISQAGYGNNVYIDNISITTELALDMELTSVVSPGRYSCETSVTPGFVVTNKGSEIIQSFTLNYNLDGGVSVGRNFTGLSLSGGESLLAEFDPIILMESNYTMNVTLSLPNGDVDAFTGNNFLEYRFGVDDTRITPPDEEEFENSATLDWMSFADDQLLNWDWQPDEWLKISSYNSSANSGSESWLISPIYDFSTIDKAGMFFDIAYSKIAGGSEEVFLMVSTDCGTTFDGSLYQRGGHNLSTAAAQANFFPNANDWREEFILLNSLAGESDLRFALRSIHGGGNNVYVDNIKLFIDDDPDPVEIENDVSKAYPNPTSTGKSNITFNLDEKEDVLLMIYDRMGRRVFEKEMTNVLNQTFEIDLSDKSMGIYIVQIVGKTVDVSFRLMVVH